MTDLETDIPEQIENLLNDLLEVGRDFFGAFVMQEHDVDIAKRIEFSPAIPAKRDKGEPQLCLLLAPR